jgi:hypothetical protein
MVASTKDCALRYTALYGLCTIDDLTASKHQWTPDPLSSDMAAPDMLFTVVICTQ